MISSTHNNAFTFIDLFAGIGGLRLPYQERGGRCVMTSELDKFARQTYQSYFDDSEEHKFNHDIKDLPPEEVPNHDILLAGFPCQSFSLAGVSKKNSLGREHGFDDPTTGTLFFNIKEILKAKQPDAFLLENVKNLTSHDQGRTWKVIAYCLDKAGYAFTYKVLDAAEVVPQHRERVFIVGFHRDKLNLKRRRRDWEPFWRNVEKGLTEKRKEQAQLYDASEEDWPKVGHILEDNKDIPEKYTLSEKLWNYLQEYKRKHQAKGNGFGYGKVTPDSDYTRTISARYHKDGSEALVDQGDYFHRPRRLTPLECCRLQGFPLDFQRQFTRDKPEVEQPVSDTQAYQQFGNSVCVPVVSAISDVHLSYLTEPSRIQQLSAPEEPIQEPLFEFEDDQLQALIQQFTKLRDL